VPTSNSRESVRIATSTQRLEFTVRPVLTLMLLMISVHAGAQSAAGEALRYEVSPLAGYRVGGNLKQSIPASR